MPRNSSLKQIDTLNSTYENYSNKVIRQKAESLWQVHPTPRLYPLGGSIGLTV